MNKKMAVQVFAPIIIIAVLMITIVGLSAPAPGIQLDSLLSRPGAGTPFNYEEAAENQAFRWQAMANAYKDSGLLTRDDFDYEAAAENSAFRWQAMADAYRTQAFFQNRGIPTTNLHELSAGDSLAFRWQTMAKYYEKRGLLYE